MGSQGKTKDSATFIPKNATHTARKPGEGNFSSRWARYGKIKYFAGRTIIYSQSELLYTVSLIQSAAQSKALHGPDPAGAGRMLPTPVVSPLIAKEIFITKTVHFAPLLL